MSGELEPFYTQIVSKYLRDVRDVKQLMMTSKRNQMMVRSLHMNTVPIHSIEDMELFSSMQTLYIYGDRRLDRRDVNEAEMLTAANKRIFRIRSQPYVGISQVKTVFKDPKWIHAVGILTDEDLAEFTADRSGLLDLSDCSAQYIDIRGLASSENYRTEVTSVRLPVTMTVLESGLMQRLPNVTALTVPDSVTRIGDSAFFSAGVINIKLPDGLKEVEESAFSCTLAAEINLPSGVSKIGDSAFQGALITSIKLPEATIADSAFSYCQMLRSITLPTSLTKIPKLMLYGCDVLEEVVCGSMIKTVGHEAFRNCYNLQRLNLPDSVESIGKSAFYACTQLNELKLPTSLTELTMSFQECGIEEADIPDGVTEISSGAFLDSNIHRVTIPSSVKFIESRAFCGCAYLSSLSIPSTVEYLQHNILERCNALTSLTVPTLFGDYDGVIKVVTQPGGNIMTITPPDYLYEINGKERVFKVMDKYVPPQDWTIETNELSYVRAKNMVIKDTVRTIEKGACIENEFLESLYIPAIVQLSEKAFVNCTRLTSVTMGPQSRVPRFIFYKCPNLRSVITIN